MCSSESDHPFNNDNDKDPSLTSTILTHLGNIGTIGMIFDVSIGVYCFKFWIRSASPRHKPFLHSHHDAIVDDDVEVAPIYKCRGMVEEPRRPHKYHDLCIEQEAARS